MQLKDIKKMRKIFLLAIIFSLVFTISSKPSCDHKNPLLPALKGFGIQMFDDPEKANVHCAPEWSTYKTCCNATTAGQFLAKRSQSNFDLINTILQQLVTVKQEVQNYITTKLPATEDLGTATSTDKAYLALSRLLNATTDKLHEDERACLKTINDISQRSLCDVCSGRSEQFFQGGKYLIHEPVCRRVLNDCGDSWKALVQISQAMNTFTNLVNDLSAAQTTAQALSSTITSYTNLIKLDGYFSQCDDFSTCPFAVVKPLCEHFITVINPSYLESFAKRQILETMVKKLTEASDKYARKALKAKRKLKDLKNDNNADEDEIKAMKARLNSLRAKVRDAKDSFSTEMKNLDTANKQLEDQKKNALNRRLQVASPAGGFAGGDVMVTPTQYPPTPNTLQVGFYAHGP